MPDTLDRTAVRFAPRRLCHVNIFVGDVDRSLAFYNRVCGLEEVRREPGIGAGFLSNGNSHHDVGVMQVGGGVRVGIGGHVQVSEGRGERPGLNHLGWEMDSEAALVAAWQRAVKAGVEIHRTADHQLAHSVYMFDPEGNQHEFYADVVEDWRTVFNPDLEDLITAEWKPLAQAPQQKRYWPGNPELRRVKDATFKPIRTARVVMVARDFARMKTFFSDIAGLDIAHADSEMALFRGAAKQSGWDLALFPMHDGLAPGMHHFVFEIADEAELREAERTAWGAGAQIEMIFDRPDKRSLFARDPDGMRIEFRHARNGAPLPLAGTEAALRPFLL